MSVRETLEQIAHNPKVAGAVSVATTGTGAGTFLDYIPDDIGKLATLVGIVLSVILIRTHLVNLKKSKLEYKLLKEKAAKHGLEVED